VQFAGEPSLGVKKLVFRIAEKEWRRKETGKPSFITQWGGREERGGPPKGGKQITRQRKGP